MKYKIYIFNFLMVFVIVSFVLAQQQPQNEPTAIPKGAELDETR